VNDGALSSYEGNIDSWHEME